jgi:hypothetical protein
MRSTILEVIFIGGFILIGMYGIFAMINQMEKNRSVYQCQAMADGEEVCYENRK